MRMKIYFLFLIFAICAFPFYGMEDLRDFTPVIEEQKSPLTLFQDSPKYLIHIGFKDGMPESNLMEPSPNDPALYFSINGVFPKTKLMPRLDKCPFVLIVPLKTVMDKVLSFHPTEVLLAGSLNIDQKGYYLIAPDTYKHKDTFENLTIKTYHGSLEERNLCAIETLKSLGAYYTAPQSQEH